MIKEKLKPFGKKGVVAILTYYCVKGMLTTCFIWIPLLFALVH